MFWIDHHGTVLYYTSMKEIPLSLLPKTIEKLPKYVAEVGASALNSVAFMVLRNLQQEITNKFDRPKKTTISAIIYEKATIDNLVVKIKPRDTNNGTPPANYLLPNILGGKRKKKGFENVLTRAGFLSAPGVMVPTTYAKKDQYGNLPSGEIVKMLSNIKSFGEEGFTANATNSKRSKKKRKAQGSYFARYLEDTKDNGATIFFRKGSDIVPVLIPKPNIPTYKPIIDYKKIIDDTYDQNIEKEYKASMIRKGFDLIK